MIIKKEETYHILKDEKNDFSDFASYLNKKIPQKFSTINIVVDLLKYDSISPEELLQFLPVSNMHRANKKSFVLVTNSVSLDAIPDELVVVPTILEAGDIIEMEEIERELGF